MSARAPFVPRPSSRLEANDKPRPPSPPAGYEAFRPNGLLGTDTGAQAHTANSEHPSDALNGTGPPLAPQGFKPLNVSALAKVKHAPKPTKSRSSLDGSAPGAPLRSRSPKPFPAAQHKPLAVPRASSPFFPNSGLNAFRVPPPPQAAQQIDDLSSNKAHTVISASDNSFDSRKDLHTHSNATTVDSFRFLDASIHRSRTASHPSLESIREVDEEHESTSPRKVQGTPVAEQGAFSGYSDDYPEPAHGEEHPPTGLRRTVKRIDRTEDEEEFRYGTGAKRYKLGSLQDDYATPFSGQVSPVHYSTHDFNQTGTPARDPPLLPSQNAGKSEDNFAKQALYTLLGQDLDICVAAHADAYEQAKKKWLECSMEEWTKGADELSAKFSKMLDFVKDHMTAKLALYASLQTTISDHRTVLSSREKDLGEARESLLREGGAVVGGAAKVSGEVNEV